MNEPLQQSAPHTRRAPDERALNGLGIGKKTGTGLERVLAVARDEAVFRLVTPRCPPGASGWPRAVPLSLLINNTRSQRKFQQVISPARRHRPPPPSQWLARTG